MGGLYEKKDDTMRERIKVLLHYIVVAEQDYNHLHRELNSSLARAY